MANMLEEIKSLVSHSEVADIANYWGEPEAKTSQVLELLIPIVLGGLIQKSNEKLAFSKVYELLEEEQNLANKRGNSVLGAGEANLLNQPKEGPARLTKLLFGNKIGGILDLISNFVGVKKNAISSLLGVIESMVVEYLTQKIIKDNLSEVGLATYLQSQQKKVLGSLPADLSSLLGFGKKSNTSNMTTMNQVKKWLPWVLGLLGLLGILYFWKGPKNQGPNTPSTSVASTKQPEVEPNTAATNHSNQSTPSSTAQIGAYSKKKLACGKELDIPENGVEAQLVTFIEDKNLTVEKETWFTMDRLVFQNGQSTLDVAKSAEQLRNIADILKCYPNVVLKIGGYTDNTGKKEDNLKLSTLRANTVKATIVALGAKPSSMEAEGYGDQFPKAPNDTEEGRALNRRIDIRVKAK